MTTQTITLQTITFAGGIEAFRVADEHGMTVELFDTNDQPIDPATAGTYFILDDVAQMTPEQFEAFKNAEVN